MAGRNIDIFAWGEVKTAWREIKRNKFDYAFLFLQIVLFSDMLKNSRSDIVLLMNLALSFIVCVYANRLDVKKVMMVSLVAIVIMLPALIVDGWDNYIPYVGYVLRIITGCLIASYYAERFYPMCENLVFLLAYISIPLFILQQIEPHIYDIFTPLSRFWMEGRQWYTSDEIPSIHMHQYILIYVLNGYAPRRNSGFMWEPAAFAAMLVWAILMNIYLRNFTINGRVIVMVLAMLTTFSLGGYSYLIVLLVIYVWQKANIKYAVGVTLVAALGWYVFNTADFLSKQREMMSEKAEAYADVDAETERLEVKTQITFRGDEEKQYQVGSRTNRVASIFVNWKLLKNNPLGYGVQSEQYIDSANGFMNLVMKWGIQGIIVLIFLFMGIAQALSYYTMVYYHQKISLIVKMLSASLWAFTFIGNPFYNQVFMFAFLFISLFINPQRIVRV